MHEEPLMGSVTARPNITQAGFIIWLPCSAFDRCFNYTITARISLDPR